MELERLRIFIRLSMLTASIIFLLVFYRLYMKGREAEEKKKGMELYKELEERFIKSRSMDHEKLRLWLKSVGAGYLIRGFDKPFFFLAANTFLSIAVLLVFGWLYSVPTALMINFGMIGAELITLTEYDRLENDNMVQDIFFLYESVSAQLATNVYVVHAIANCMEYIKSRRLRLALGSLCDNLALGGDMKAATEDFKEKFNNAYLDTFCNMLVRISTETGVQGELIGDMSKQLQTMHETIFDRRKKVMETKLMIYIIGMFIVAFAVIFYLAMSIMSGAAEGMLF